MTQETNEHLSNESKHPKKTVEKYCFENVKTDLENLTTIESKIERIEALKAEYLQQDMIWDFNRVPFDKKCDIELKKLHRLLDLRLKIEKSKPSRR